MSLTGLIGQIGRAPRGSTRATLAALAIGCCASSAPALAQTGASMHASFLPDRLGTSTSLTLSLAFFGGEEGVPAPLSAMVVHLPAGLSINLAGVPTCAGSRLSVSGPRGCPAGSLLGHGHALLEAHTGSLTLSEPSTISVLRGPNRGGSATIEIYAHGDSPLYESTISIGVLSPDSSPYGSKLSVSIPRMPTIEYEPDASFKSMSLTVGNVQPAHAPGTIVIPRSCPAAGSLAFAADITFADRSTTSASSAVACR